jgi:hypothetical protein
MKTGVVVLASAVLSGSATAASNQYAVEGVAVGTQLNFNSASYREYKCSPSEQFDGLTWCQKARPAKDRRGPYTAAYSLLHARDGSIVYVNRTQEPLFLARNEAEGEIQRYARTIGEAPRIMNMPQRGGLRNGMIAVWGDVKLEQLDGESVKILAVGKSPKKGLLIDFLGNFARSAKEGLPVYRVASGTGFLWAANFDQKARGTLRTVAVNTSGLSSARPEEQGTLQAPTDEAEPQAKQAEATETIAESQAEPATRSTGATELEQVPAGTETARETMETASVDVEAVTRELEQAKAEITALEATIAQLSAAGSAGSAKNSRWENVLFGSAGGLFGALAVFVIGSFVNRQKAAAAAKQQTSDVDAAPMLTSPGDEGAELISPALSPTIAISESAFESELDAQVDAINAAEEKAVVAADAAASEPEPTEKVTAPAIV